MRIEDLILVYNPLEHWAASLVWEAEPTIKPFYIRMFPHVMHVRCAKPVIGICPENRAT